MLWQRGEEKTWWYRFKFAGRVFEESTRTSNRRRAERILVKRRNGLEEGLHGLRKRVTPVLFRVAAQDWLKAKTPSLAPRTVELHECCLVHVNGVLGGLLITDTEARDISDYQEKRRNEKAAPKTTNLEVGVIRGVLRHHKLWGRLADDVRMLPTRDDVGRALAPEEEALLLVECAKSRSRVLHPFVVLALHTGMRYTELRLLQWQQVDLVGRVLTVGPSKTEAGTGRAIPINERAFTTLTTWAAQFPARKPHHYVFPSEQYGLSGNDREIVAHDCKPGEPTTSIQSGWKHAKKRSGVRVRLHDLRHTACTRHLEGGIPLTVVGAILGWAGSTMVLMAKRYGHIGQQAKQDALAVLDRIGAPKKATDAESQQPPPATVALDARLAVAAVTVN